MKWIRVEERQPEINQTVLGIVYPGNSYIEEYVYYGPEISDPKTHEDYAWSHGCYITHWMPLPEPPNTIKSTLSYEEREHIEKGGKWLDEDVE